MPEGDTVARQCRILDDALSGAVLTRCDVRVPRAATTALADWSVAEVRPRGKHLLWWAGEETTDEAAAQLVRAVAEDSRLPQLRIERIDGHGIDTEPVARITAALERAGCYRSPRSLRLRAGDR